MHATLFRPLSAQRGSNGVSSRFPGKSKTTFFARHDCDCMKRGSGSGGGGFILGKGIVNLGACKNMLFFFCI